MGGLMPQTIDQPSSPTGQRAAIDGAVDRLDPRPGARRRPRRDGRGGDGADRRRRHVPGVGRAVCWRCGRGWCSVPMHRGVRRRLARRLARGARSAAGSGRSHGDGRLPRRSCCRRSTCSARCCFQDELDGATSWAVVSVAFGLGSIVADVLLMRWRPRFALRVAAIGPGARLLPGDRSSVVAYRWRRSPCSSSSRRSASRLLSRSGRRRCRSTFRSVDLARDEL